MKSDIHPENYRLVAFKDMSNDDVFITKSTVETKETTKIDGVGYPLFKLEISRTSHPYYTGKSKLVDTAGRVDKFRSKYADFNKTSDVKEDTPVDEKKEIPESKTEKDVVDMDKTVHAFELVPKLVMSLDSMEILDERTYTITDQTIISYDALLQSKLEKLDSISMEGKYNSLALEIVSEAEYLTTFGLYDDAIKLLNTIPDSD